MSETYKKRITDFLSSILMPRTVRTNNCDGLIHLLACLTMLIDHSGKVLFGNMAQMRIIGRLAFPLFAYSLAAGVVFTHDSRKYLTRIVLLALISQPFYALGLLHTTPAMFAVPFLKNPLGAALTFYLASWQTPSILLSLSLALCILIALRDRNYILAIGVYVLCERFGSAFDYRIGGSHDHRLCRWFVGAPPGHFVIPPIGGAVTYLLVLVSPLKEALILRSDRLRSVP